jgi:hypothetical protein
MAIGEEYLVSGARERYGVLSVNGCSRTRPLKSAQLDLRTLDGSHCAAPGGTLIGTVRKGNDRFRGDSPLTENVTVTLRDQDGNTYTARSDQDGIYEFQHLATGTYTVESLVNQNQYASAGGVSVVEGQCMEVPILLRDYSLRGRFLPGLMATVKLVGVDDPSKMLRSDSLEPDGRFYFRDVPDGEYLLSAETWIGAPGDLYYPGTFDRRKASQFEIRNQVLSKGRTLEFNPKLLPIVPIRVALDPPGNSLPFSWRVLLSWNGSVQEKNWFGDEKSVLLYGMRGATYSLGLYGFAKHPMESKDCRTGTVPVVANPAMVTTHITVPPNCQ